MSIRSVVFWENKNAQYSWVLVVTELRVRKVGKQIQFTKSRNQDCVFEMFEMTLQLAYEFGYNKHRATDFLASKSLTAVLKCSGFLCIYFLVASEHRNMVFLLSLDLKKIESGLLGKKVTVFFTHKSARCNVITWLDLIQEIY